MMETGRGQRASLVSFPYCVGTIRADIHSGDLSTR